MESEPVMSCVLKFDNSTSGWQKSLNRVFKKLTDVSFSIDAFGFAYVSGKVEPSTILKVLAKAGKHADLLWVDYGVPKDKNQNRSTNVPSYFYRPGEAWHHDPYHNYYYPSHVPPPMAALPPPPPSAIHYPQTPFMFGELNGAESQCRIM